MEVEVEGVVDDVMKPVYWCFCYCYRSYIPSLFQWFCYRLRRCAQSDAFVSYILLSYSFLREV